MPAPRQGLGGPWLLPLILPGVNSYRVKQVLLAQAEAEKIRKLGEAEAAVIEAMGTAEAERMKLKAEAYQKYGDAAKMALVLEALPQVRPPPWVGLGGLFQSTATGWLEAFNVEGPGSWAGPLQHTWAHLTPWVSDCGLQIKAPSCAGMEGGRRRRERSRMGRVDRGRTSQALLPPPHLLDCC